jgi:hypothetical protein
VAIVSERYLVLFYLFLILPLFDMANGFLVVGGYLSEGGIASPSQIGRLLAVLIFLVVCIFKKLNSIWVFVALYLIGLETFYGVLHQSEFGVIFGIISAYKLIYIVLTSITLKYYLNTEQDYYLLGKFIKWNLYLISGTLLFSLLTGIGNSTYGHGFGTKGFFASGNGLGVYMGVMTLVMFAFKKYKIYTNVSATAIVIFALSTGLVGSKTAMLLSLICLLTLMWFSCYRLYWLILFGVSFSLVFPLFYNVIEVVFDVVINRYENSESLFMFIGSGRIDYVADAFSVFLEQGSINLRLVFGSGAFVSFQDPSSVSSYDTLETDLFDVLFMYGFVGLIFFFASSIYISFHLRKYFILLFAFILLFFHSIIAGHVLFNGMSSFPIVLLFLLSVFLKNRRNDA